MKTEPSPKAEIRRRFPGVAATNPFEMFGRDTLQGLARAIVQSEQSPNERARIVSEAEVLRVVARCCADLPDPVRRRLQQMADGTTPRPRGRRGATTLQTHTELGVLAYYKRRKMWLERLAEADRLTAWRQKLNQPDYPATPAQIAYWLTKRLHYPQLSLRAVANRITKIRKRFR